MIKYVEVLSGGINRVSLKGARGLYETDPLSSISVYNNGKCKGIRLLLYLDGQEYHLMTKDMSGLKFKEVVRRKVRSGLLLSKTPYRHNGKLVGYYEGGYTSKQHIH